MFNVSMDYRIMDFHESGWQIMKSAVYCYLNKQILAGSK